MVILDRPKLHPSFIEVRRNLSTADVTEHLRAGSQIGGDLRPGRRYIFLTTRILSGTYDRRPWLEPTVRWGRRATDGRREPPRARPDNRSARSARYRPSPPCLRV